MKPLRLMFSLMVAIMIATISACGGGDLADDTSTIAAIATVNVDAAATSALTTSISAVNLQAPPDQFRNKWTVSVSSAPSGTFVFNGETLQTRTQTVQFTLNGRSLAKNSSRTAFRTAPLTPVVSNDALNWSLVTVLNSLPTAASVPSRGVFFQTRHYTDSTFSFPDGVTQTAWSLSSLTQTTASLCFRTTGERHLQPVDTTECYEVASTGTVTRLVSFEQLVNGRPLLFK